MTDDVLRVCANCRVLVQPVGAGPPDSPLLVWEHVPQFAEKFSRSVCERPDPSRAPSGSERRFGLARVRSNGGDKQTLRGALEEFALPPGAPVTVAVDGSYKLTIGERVVKPMSWAYLSTSGLYGLGTSIVPGYVTGDQRSHQAELRAIANALQAIGDAGPVTVICDDKRAIDLMLLWRDGHSEIMPGGYNTDRASGRESTLARLARRAREAGDRITMQWVPSHTGHPLNEAADALAKMARAWATGRLGRDTVGVDARSIVQAALQCYGTDAAA